MPKAERIFVVDADVHQAESLARDLAEHGSLATALTRREELEARILTDRPDAVIVDLEWEDGALLEILDGLEKGPDRPLVFATAAAPALAEVVEAVRRGVADVFEKPLFPGEVIASVETALTERRRRRRTAAAPAPAGRRPEIIGSSEPLQGLLESLALVTRAPRATVLVQGESGTGKELIARAIHFDGPRAGKAFLAVNCATLTENLLEAELFGYEKGAFTGALDSGKKGLFEAADGGTLFLDEIGELAGGLQAKLLRVLQEGAFKRVGGVEDVRVDVRIIAATNRDLRREVREGRFRDDLFYRLNVVPLRVPPLRERREDIAELAGHFLARSAEELGKSIRGLSREALAHLGRYDWPGNVRELRNICEYAAIVCDAGLVEPRHLTLPDGAESGIDGASRREDESAEATIALEPRSLRDMESELIRVVLGETRFNVTRAAGILGINRSTLYNKMRDYGLEREERPRMRQTV
ncbi:MAG: sigma-54 dependent transcriptional regulator [Planctomycetota bacterium]